MEWMDRPGDDSNVHPRKKGEKSNLLMRVLNWERVGERTIEEGRAFIASLREYRDG